MSHSSTTQKVTTEQLIEQWLHGHADNTIKTYQQYLGRFLAHVDKPIDEVTLFDLQTWQLSLRNLSPASQGTALAVIKSLFSFGFQLGVLPLNVAKLVKSPPSKDCLAQKILCSPQVQTMIELEKNTRNRAILFMLYGCGLRVSELCDLKWQDVKPRDHGGQVTVFGKGGKTRVVLIPPPVWNVVGRLKGDYGGNDPVFRSRQKGLNGYHVSRKQVWRIVRKAAERAGIDDQVSPHWLRYSHASHSLDKGAPLSLVKETLGHSSIAITEKYLHAKPDDSSGMYLFD
jgi:integrase/recombinase XerD